MTRSYTIGGLNRFLKEFPRVRVTMERAIDGSWTINRYTGAGGLPGMVIASYSRDRDCWRALRRLGYVREGLSWKPPSQPVSMSATDEMVANLVFVEGTD